MNIIVIEKVSQQRQHRYSSWNFVFMCFRNQITLNIGFSSLLQLSVRFLAAILEKLVKISENCLQHFLVRTYSGKVTKAFVTILAVSGQPGKNPSGG